MNVSDAIQKRRSVRKYKPPFRGKRHHHLVKAVDRRVVLPVQGGIPVSYTHLRCIRDSARTFCDMKILNNPTAWLDKAKDALLKRMQTWKRNKKNGNSE